MDRNHDVPGDGEANPLATTISGMPEVWQRLLIEHVPDDHGRCTACRSSGMAGVPWPCTLRVIAEDAQTICGGPTELSGPRCDAVR